MHRTKVLLTVDTEPSIAGAMVDLQRHAPLLDEPVWGEVNGTSQALGFLTRTLQQFDLKATFFVETLHTNYFGTERMRRYTEHLQASNQDIQLHIHPVWRNFCNGESSDKVFDDDSSTIGAVELTALITQGLDQIETWTGTRPAAMRTGNFSASRAVYTSMYEAGISLSSNLCIASIPYEDTSLKHPGGVHEINKVMELPATCFIDPGPVGRGKYRSSQVTACSTAELQSILRQAHKHKVGTIVIVTHPFEFIKKSDFRYSHIKPNKLVQNRFVKLCQFLKLNSNMYETTTFGQLSKNTPLLETELPILKTSVANSVLRATQNYINDKL